MCPDPSLGRAVRVGLALAALAALLAPRPAAAALRHRAAVSGGWDSRVAPAPLQGHYWGLAAWDLDGLPLGSHLGVSLNTDTLRVTYDRIRFADGWLEAGVRAAGELFYAGLLSDYYRDGEKLGERGFQASYVTFGGSLKVNLPADHYLALSLDVRRWFFARRGGTSAALALPPAAWVAEPRVHWTFWRLQSDPSLGEAHRPFARVRGVALGVELGVDVRSEVRRWGALDPAAFDLVDPRNAPQQAIVVFRQWLRAGSQVHDRLRLQLYQTAAWGHGEDDLTRVRLGGLNPYVVPLAGAPWAALVAGRFLAAEASAHVRLWRELEAGVLLDGALAEDVHRVGAEDTFGLLGGVGVFFDLRFGGFQVDVRGGWTPSLAAADAGGAGAWSVLVAGGWQWSSE